MKKFFILLAILALSGCTAAKPVPIVVSKSYQTSSSPSIITNKIYMKLTSPDFNNGGFLPTDLSCLGEGRAPILQFADVPSSTVALALIVDDPDAPGGIFTHWLGWNFGRTVEMIDLKNPPAGTVAGTNSAGTTKYVAPCPPSGTHHYYYRLYALDRKLDLPGKTIEKNLLKAMTGHIVDEAVLMGQSAGKK
jgi:Raf kinase inhibitor-like YbhB/YbcL family protein